MSAPAITVLMPVYNAAATLREAVDSILQQTFPDWEFLILDDGSTDASSPILAEYAARERRVRVVRQSNAGVPVTLNRGLDLTQGRFLARMDADDISRPQRLEKQLAFLQTHPEVMLVGSWDQDFYEEGQQRVAGAVRSFPSAAGHVRAAMLFRNPISHPTVLWPIEKFRRHGLRYDPTCRYMEDYDLWARAADIGPVVNLPEVFLDHRLSPGGVCARFSEAQRAECDALRLRLVRQLGLEPTAAQATLHRALSWDELESNETFLTAANDWLLTLRQANDTTHVLEDDGLMRTLTGRWIALAKLAHCVNPAFYARFLNSPFLARVSPGLLPQP